MVGRNCPSYQYVQVTNVDRGFVAFYELDTGKLLAVVSHFYSGVPSARCVAGPPTFVKPAGNPCEHGVQVACSDAGVDAPADSTGDAARH